jgi:hypothetical protein
MGNKEPERKQVFKCLASGDSSTSPDPSIFIANGEIPDDWAHTVEVS